MTGATKCYEDAKLAKFYEDPFMEKWKGHTYKNKDHYITPDMGKSNLVCECPTQIGFRRKDDEIGRPLHYGGQRCQSGSILSIMRHPKQ